MGAAQGVVARGGGRPDGQEDGMTVSILPELTALFALVFARVGTLVMLLPGLGERIILSRARLSVAVFLALLMIPVARSGLQMPQTGPAVVQMLLGELMVGLILGVSARILISTLQTAGTIIANQLGLGFAMTMDPTGGVQNPSIGNLLSITGATLVLVMDLHHLAIAAIHDSYAILPPGGPLLIDDAMGLALKTTSQSFALAVQISAPFIVFGLLFNLGLGILSRLMPQLQVFFIAVPASIVIGMLVMFATIGVMLGVYLDAVGLFLRALAGR
jgi:flagellar biosynthesis protein FliR